MAAAGPVARKVRAGGCSRTNAIADVKYGMCRLTKIHAMARDFLGEPVSISNIFNGLKHTVAGLKNLQLKWNTDNLSANGQMLGFFTKASDSAGAADESVELNEKTVKLHAWMRRAASKVTVAFDGSNLKDGVSIRIKSVRIKNIPASCLLGAENKAGEGGSVSWVKHPDSHSETNPHSLFFYENRQGGGPRQEADG